VVSELSNWANVLKTHSEQSAVHCVVLTVELLYRWAVNHKQSTNACAVHSLYVFTA